MRQEAVVILIGVFLTVAAAIAIGGVPFGGDGSDVLVSDTVAPFDEVDSTTVPVSVAPDTTVPNDSERTVPSTSPTTSASPAASPTTSPVGSSIPATPTTTGVASAGPTPTTGTTEPDPLDELRDRGSLLVAAANASGHDGGSASVAAELEAAGYVGVVAVEAVYSSSTSYIYYKPGLIREVFLATADLHWDGVELLTMDLAPEIEPAGEFDLLFVVGSDRAAPAAQS